MSEKGFKIMTLTRVKRVVLVAAVAAGAFAAGVFAAQPNMQSARAHLVSAKGFLQQASRNKDGHRVSALAHVNAAIAEVDAGIAAGAD